MIKIAVCDDDEKDLKKINDIIKSYMEEKPIDYTIDNFESGEELLGAEDKFDLIFLDIVMEGINGIQTGRKLREMNRKTKVIYITNYREYCEQAVNIAHTFAYLEKPVTIDKAEQQLDEALQFLQEENNKIKTMKFGILEFSVEGKIENRTKDFVVEDILYFEYMNRKIKIKLQKEEYFMVDKIRSLTERMRLYNFEACHQCFLVNLKCVRRIKGYEIILENNESIPVSQKKSAEFRKKLNKYIQSNIWE